MPELPEVTLVSIERSHNAVSWRAGRDPPHDAEHCIHPPPFGRQCTRHSRGALLACLTMAGCTSLVFPDPAPYLKSSAALRKKRIEGAICQARSHADADERNHGMCKPSGCAVVSIEPARRDPDALFDSTASAWLSANADAFPRGARLLGLHPNLVHAARKWPALQGVLDGLQLREIGHWRAHHDATPFVLHVAHVT